MHDDPWRDLKPPASPTAISARRVDEANTWNLFWALDHDRRCLLVFRYTPAAAPRQRLPQLREIEVRGETPPDGAPVLVLRLLDAALRDVFFRLCCDIVSATSRCDTEGEAVDAAVARTWRWHHLLRGGGGGRLRPEEQMGLVGELLVFEHYLLPALGPSDAVAAWLGPLGAAKDFVAGSVGVESKARGTTSVDSVLISSEFQLADEDLDHVFLHLSALDPADPGDEHAFTLHDVAARVRGALAAGGDAVSIRFEALLAAAGFRVEDDYSDAAWLGGERSIFRVTGTFPRLTPATLPAGIAHARYTLSLSRTGPFLVPPADLHSALAARTR